MSVSSNIFCQLESPRFCFFKSFLASSKAPTEPNARRESSAAQMAPLLRSHQISVEMVMAARISTPPMVGVPALTWWCSGPSARICWPILRAGQGADHPGAQRQESPMAVAAAMAARKVTYRKTEKPGIVSRKGWRSQGSIEGSGVWRSVGRSQSTARSARQIGFPSPGYGLPVELQ